MSATPKPRPELKQYGDLRPEDFDSHPVWVACHSADYDEEWYDDTDEETFRPYSGALPVGSDEMYLVRSAYTLRDGTKMTGFATPTGDATTWGTIQPQIYLPNGQRVGVWYGMFPPQNALRKFCDSLGKKTEDIFPIRFAAIQGLTTNVCFGDIPGLMKSGKPSFELMKE